MGDGQCSLSRTDHRSFPMEEFGPAEGDSFTAPSYQARIDFLFGKAVAPLTSGIINAGEVSDHHLVWAECEI